MLWCLLIHAKNKNTVPLYSILTSSAKRKLKGRINITQMPRVAIRLTLYGRASTNSLLNFLPNPEAVFCSFRVLKIDLISHLITTRYGRASVNSSSIFLPNAKAVFRSFHVFNIDQVTPIMSTRYCGINFL